MKNKQFKILVAVSGGFDSTHIGHVRLFPRDWPKANISEVEVCGRVSCKTAFEARGGEEIQSSSWLLDKHAGGNKLRKRAQFFFFKKIIIFDLDGTLTKSKFNLDEEMAQLLCRLLEVKKVAVIGGGNYIQFQDQFLRHLGCAEDQLENLLILPTSGGELRQYKNGKWQQVYKHVLNPAEKKKVSIAFKKSFRDIGYTKPKETYGKIMEDRKSQITFSALGQKAPLRKKEEWNKKQDIRKKLKTALGKYLSGFEIRFGGLTSIDVTKKGIDKAYGITQIIKLLNARKQDLLYVGDALYKGGNDHSVKRTGIATLAVKDEGETKNFIRLLVETSKTET